MRTEKWLILCFVLLLVQLVACERSKMEENAPTPVSARIGADSLGTDSTGIDSADVPDTGPPYIVTEKTTGIEQKAPTLFTLINGKSQFVKWRVVPAQVTQNNGSQTTIYFQKAGNFRVYAIDSLSNDSAYIDVQVNDQVYVRPNYDQAIQEGDEIYLTPKAYSDTARYLEFQLVTKNDYQCTNSTLAISQNFEKPISLNVLYASPGDRCARGKGKARSTIWAAFDLPEKYSGNIEIIFDKKTYKGSFKKTGKHYEFTWPYDTGIVFTTKSL